jgi:hypothetical protein
MDTRCLFCGQSDASLYADDNNHWVVWRPAYTTQYRRYLCASCKGRYRPSLCRLLEKGDKEALRALPLVGHEAEVFKRQLETCPWHFPLKDLCEQHVHAILLSVDRGIDIQVVRLKPLEVSDYWLSFFTQREGYIYTSVPLSWTIPAVYRLEFTGTWMDRGYRCFILPDRVRWAP